MSGIFRVWPLLCCLACDALSTPSASPAPAPAPASAAPAAAPGYKSYGASITLTQPAPLRQVLGEPAQYRDKPVLVEGTVRRACSRKGCWMEIAESADPAAAACRVTFKDYGFFVPTDSAGSSARVQAVVQVETVKAATVEHLESEGARFAQKNPDGTADEVRLVATAVELKK